jgi:hypothetical protein
VLFKEIEKIVFPKQWTTNRHMWHSQKMETIINEQDIREIKNVIEQLGKFEIEIDDTQLIIYGYR